MGKTATSAKVQKGSDKCNLKVLEFYSGIGGMHAALERAAMAGDIPAFEVLAAFDINDVANRVYAHNFDGGIVRRVCVLFHFQITSQALLCMFRCEVWHELAYPTPIQTATFMCREGSRIM
jgi:site-specific DNA-cytosine methylase